MDWVLIVGLLLHAATLPIVLRRLWFLFRLMRNGQPAPDRIAGVTSRVGRAVRTELVEVFGQRRLLKWTLPGFAHFFVFWAFVILGSVYVEAYGVLLGPDDFAIPLVGHWSILGFAQDAIALMALVSISLFGWIRVRNAPAKLGRKSRFKGSHEFGAYLVLFLILNVIWTMFLFRGSAAALGNFDNSGAFVSNAVGGLLDGLSTDTLHMLEGLGLLLHIGVMLVFLIEVVHSKHLHVLIAPVNVLFKRQPIALGAAKPLTSAGRAVTLDDLEEMDEDTRLGVGAIEDFSWKGILDFASCTECGRCQSQCPAWNTEKPLSPKLMIMALRDHAYDKGPWLLTDESARDGAPAKARAEAGRPLVGETEGEPWAPTGGGVIDPDVLWSCVTCGACVQQCPVDIEHVDHIVDMRRYQVLVESNFPAELNQLFKGMESKGNPWNMSPNMRMDWAKGLDFDVPVVGEDLESLDSVDWLFWVGCAGAYEDRAMKTTRAVAELLHTAGVSFGVLGKGETCTGDSARRAGNEFVFQGLASANIETFREYRVKKVVSTCAHCFNTLKNEYRELGIELEVVHHTQLLNRLVREGRLTPVADGAGAARRSITYHDPCYIGRHNQVYAPPRELLQVLPGAEVVEMERNSERSFCCGAGGARMWMEETIGERINTNRTTEAVGTGADQIAVGCPFCRVMLSDGLTALQDSGAAREEVEVLDVAQMLLASVKGVPATRSRAGAPAAGATAAATGTAVMDRDEAVEAEPETGDTTQQVGGIAETSEVGPAAKASGGGSSLFDVGGDEPAAPAEPAPSSGGSLFDLGGDQPDAPAEPAPSSGGSLFDLGGDQPDAPAGPAAGTPPTPGPTSGGSLFDLGTPEEVSAGDPAPAPADEREGTAAAETAPVPATDLGSGGSLFDLAAPEEPSEPDEPAEPAPAATSSPASPEPSPPRDSGTAPAPSPATAIPEGSSLFDLGAPAEPAEPAEPAVTPAPDEEPEPTSEAHAPTEEADPATGTDEPPPEAPAADREPGHQPRKDADIGGSGSLFDL